MPIWSSTVVLLFSDQKWTLVQVRDHFVFPDALQPDSEATLQWWGLPQNVTRTTQYRPLKRLSRLPFCFLCPIGLFSFCLSSGLQSGEVFAMVRSTSDSRKWMFWWEFCCDIFPVWRGKQICDVIVTYHCYSSSLLPRSDNFSFNVAWFWGIKYWKHWILSCDDEKSRLLIGVIVFLEVGFQFLTLEWS